MKKQRIFKYLAVSLLSLYVIFFLPHVGTFHLERLGFNQKNIVSSLDFVQGVGYSSCDFNSIDQENLEFSSWNTSNKSNFLDDIKSKMEDFKSYLMDEDDPYVCVGVAEIDTKLNPSRFFLPHRFFVIWNNRNEVMHTASLYAKNIYDFRKSFLIPVEGRLKIPDSFLVKSLFNDPYAKVRVSKSKLVKLHSVTENLDNIDNLEEEIHSNFEDSNYSAISFGGDNCWTYSEKIYRLFD